MNTNEKTLDEFSNDTFENVQTSLGKREETQAMQYTFETSNGIFGIGIRGTTSKFQTDVILNPDDTIEITKYKGRYGQWRKKLKQKAYYKIRRTDIAFMKIEREPQILLMFIATVLLVGGIILNPWYLALFALSCFGMIQKSIVLQLHNGADISFYIGKDKELISKFMKEMDVNIGNIRKGGIFKKGWFYVLVLLILLLLISISALPDNTSDTTDTETVTETITETSTENTNKRTAETQENIDWLSNAPLFYDIEKRFGKITYEYNMEGADCYKAENGWEFLFDSNSSQECVYFGVPITELYPGITDYADENGIISRKNAELFFESKTELELLESGDYWLTVESLGEIFECDENGNLTTNQVIYFECGEQSGLIEEEDAASNAENFEDYSWVQYDDLCRIPGDFIGEKLCYEGIVQQVISESSDEVLFSFDISLNDDWSESQLIVVKYNRKDINEARFLEDDSITIYGTFVGLKSYTRAIGDTKVLMPTIDASYIYTFDPRGSAKADSYYE